MDPEAMVPELMRAVLVLLLLGACGRLRFDETVTDAAEGPPDALAAYTSVVLADNPHFYYRLEESAGSVARDEIGRFDASYIAFMGSITYAQPGALGREPSTGVLIDGDGNTGPKVGAAVERAPIDTFAGDFTVELFFKPTAPPGGGFNGALFLCETHMGSGFRTGVRADLNLVLWTDEGGGTSVITGTVPLAIGTWAHLVFVNRGGIAELWKDGALVGGSPVGMIPPMAGAECGFGSFHGMPSYGVFDEVSGYTRALSPVQIAQHFAAR